MIKTVNTDNHTEEYVFHPRYGKEPITSEHQLTEAMINKAHWRYKTLRTFPHTAIPADVSKQSYAIYPRSIYVDIEETCENCNRPFIFFAKEQQHWFEELGFWVDAHCVRCIDCRKQAQEINIMQKRYQTLITTNNRDIAQTKELEEIAKELYLLGYIKDVSKLKIK